MATALFNDVFGQDAFGFLSLSEAVNMMPYVESRLGQLGIFNGLVEGTETDTVVIDETEGQLQILKTLPRGADPERAAKEKKNKSRAIKIPHLQFEDRIMASSLLGKRAPGKNQLETVAQKVNDRFQFMLTQAVAPTLEVHRLNALRGILLDADGSVIHNYFDFFGVTQQTKNFQFSLATLNVREQCHQALRMIEDYLDGVPFTGVRALCGRNFFDALIKHPSVRDTYLNWTAAAELRGDVRKNVFEFGGIMWEEYRGMRSLPNGIGVVADAECIIYPEGVAGMYRTYYAPADFLETVDQLGQPLYAKVAPDWKYNRWVDTLMETNPLFINVRPRAVLKGTMS